MAKPGTKGGDAGGRGAKTKIPAPRIFRRPRQR